MGWWLREILIKKSWTEICNKDQHNVRWRKQIQVLDGAISFNLGTPTLSLSHIGLLSLSKTKQIVAYIMSFLGITFDTEGYIQIRMWPQNTSFHVNSVVIVQWFGFMNHSRGQCIDPSTSKPYAAKTPYGSSWVIHRPYKNNPNNSYHSVHPRSPSPHMHCVSPPPPAIPPPFPRSIKWIFNDKKEKLHKRNIFCCHKCPQSVKRNPILHQYGGC